MKSRKVIVPRSLIKKFYPHPEPFGNGSYVVDLVNGMFTDVYYREAGDFVTLTNDRTVISFLKKNPLESRAYFYRNGVYAFRLVQDFDKGLIDGWRGISPISIQLDLPKEPNLPTKFMFCFYWIEVGIASIEESRLSLDIFENDLIHMIDVGVAIDLVLEHLNSAHSN